MEAIQQKTKNSFALAVFIATSTGVAWGQTPESGVGLSDEFSLGPAIQATRLDYSRFEIPASVTVLTQEDIRRQGFIEVSEIFRAVPGFRIVKIGDESRISYHSTSSGAVPLTIAASTCPAPAESTETAPPDCSVSRSTRGCGRLANRQRRPRHFLTSRARVRAGRRDPGCYRPQ